MEDSALEMASTLDTSSKSSPAVESTSEEIATDEKLLGDEGQKRKREDKDMGTMYTAAKRNEASNKRKRLQPNGGKKAQVKEDPLLIYDFRNGLRHVRPYVHVFKTHAKERWYGRRLLDVLTSEFGAQDAAYYTKAIESGRILLNNATTSVDTQMKNGDLLVHKMHRHEPSVLGDEIKAFHDNDEVLVVSKPSSIPTHPSGPFRYNSLSHILELERPDQKLFLVHRLDRLTSGLIIFAKTVRKAQEISKDIASRQAHKIYLARVQGDFPSSEEAANEVAEAAKAKVSSAQVQYRDDGSIHVDCPIAPVSIKDAVHACQADGKECQTTFRKLSFNGTTSLVQCEPLTGRTHQIRLHLQLLGHPIANDPCYGGVPGYGQRLENGADDIKASLRPQVGQDISGGEERQSAKDDAALDEERSVIELCKYCNSSEDESNSTKEKEWHCTEIWLHALRYIGPTWRYEVEEPYWASNDFTL